MVPPVRNNPIVLSEQISDNLSGKTFNLEFDHLKRGESTPDVVVNQDHVLTIPGVHLDDFSELPNDEDYQKIDEDTLETVLETISNISGAQFKVGFKNEGAVIFSDRGFIGKRVPRQYRSLPGFEVSVSGTYKDNTLTFTEGCEIVKKKSIDKVSLSTRGTPGTSDFSLDNIDEDRFTGKSAFEAKVKFMGMDFAYRSGRNQDTQTTFHMFQAGLDAELTKRIPKSLQAILDKLPLKLRKLLFKFGRGGGPLGVLVKPEIKLRAVLKIDQHNSRTFYTILRLEISLDKDLLPRALRRSTDFVKPQVLVQVAAIHDQPVFDLPIPEESRPNIAWVEKTAMAASIDIEKGDLSNSLDLNTAVRAQIDIVNSCQGNAVETVEEKNACYADDDHLSSYNPTTTKSSAYYEEEGEVDIKQSFENNTTHNSFRKQPKVGVNGKKRKKLEGRKNSELENPLYHIITVKKGDTAFNIAEDYGIRRKFEKFLKLNSKHILRLSKIYEGDKLYIPKAWLTR